MAFQVSGKNITIGEALAERVKARVQALIDRQGAKEYNGHLTLAREGSGFRADCTIHLPAGVQLKAEASGHEAYTCADEAVERLGRRIAREWTKVKSHAGPKAPGDADLEGRPA